MLHSLLPNSLCVPLVVDYEPVHEMDYEPVHETDLWVVVRSPETTDSPPGAIERPVESASERWSAACMAAQGQQIRWIVAVFVSVGWLSTGAYLTLRCYCTVL